MRNAILAVTVSLTVTSLGLGAGTVSAPYVPGEFILKQRETVAAGRIDALLASKNCAVRERVEALDLMLVRILDGRTEEQVMEDLAAEPDVEFVHLNYIGQGGFIPDDTHFADQWHHDNTGQTGGTVGADIQTVDAWDITRGGAGVVVAVLDTGIDSDHPDFAGRIVAGWDFVNGDNDPEADHPHGAQVTGLLAANGNNAFGVAGVDHQCRIMPVKVLDQNNAGTTMNLINGLNFAATNGADIISMSLINYPGSAGLITALQAARYAGAILIACAGNGGIGDADVSFPGASPLTISIGATNDDDQRAAFSGTGAELDLVAPGDSVRTILFNSATDTFSNFSGCSAATPVAAGVAALAFSVDPTLTHDQMRQILIDGAEDQVGNPVEDVAGRDDFYGFGRINALRTLCELDTADPQILCLPDAVFECNASGGIAASDPAMAAFLGGASASDDLDPDPDVTTDAPAFFQAGTTTAVTFTATDKCSKASTCTASATVTDTTPPAIVCPPSITVECTGNCGIEADDPQLTSFFSGVTVADVCDPSPTITNDAPGFLALGLNLVVFTASDDAGNAASCATYVTVVDTTPPEIEVTLNRYELWPPNHKLVDITAAVEVKDICDPNASFVLTSITSDEPDNALGDGDTPNDIQGHAIGTADSSFQLRSERAGTDDGRTYTIVYTASDKSGNTATATVQVEVPHDRTGRARGGAGLVAMGTAIASAATQFELVAFAEGDFRPDAAAALSVRIGNSRSVIDALSSRLVDVDLDGDLDVVMRFPAEQTRILRKTSGTEPIALRYGAAGRPRYLVLDIFALGSPIATTR